VSDARSGQDPRWDIASRIPRAFVGGGAAIVATAVVSFAVDGGSGRDGFGNQSAVTVSELSKSPESNNPSRLAIGPTVNCRSSRSTTSNR